MSRLYTVTADPRHRCVPYSVALHMFKRYMLMYRLKILVSANARAIKPVIMATDMWQED